MREKLSLELERGWKVYARGQQGKSGCKTNRKCLIQRVCPSEVGLDHSSQAQGDGDGWNLSEGSHLPP